jgi:hypothetical protein
VCRRGEYHRADRRDRPLVAISIFCFVAAGLALAMRPAPRTELAAVPAQ